MAGTTTTKPSTALAKSLGASLAIQSVDELCRLAEVLYLGGANQIEGCGRKEAVAHIILAGAEVGLAPTCALSTIMLVNGKTSVYGDGALALVYASGLLAEIKEWPEGEGDNLTYHCRVKRKGEEEPIVRSFSVTDAKIADLWQGGSGPKKKANWVKYWKRMMTMRARGFALRDKFPDVMKGLAIWEEVIDGITASGDVLNTEVKVIGTTVDAPTKPLISVNEPEAVLAASVAPAPTVPDGPITDEQKAELARLHKLIMAAKGLVEAAPKKAAWEQIIAPYGVASMNAMTRAVAAKAILDLGLAYDPFTYPATLALPT